MNEKNKESLEEVPNSIYHHSIIVTEIKRLHNKRGPIINEDCKSDK